MKKIILDNAIKTFNETFKVKLKFGSFAGGQTNYLQLDDQTSKGIICTKSQAVDIVNFVQYYLDELENVNAKRRQTIRIDGDSKN